MHCSFQPTPIHPYPTLTLPQSGCSVCAGAAQPGHDSQSSGAAAPCEQYPGHSAGRGSWGGGALESGPAASPTGSHLQGTAAVLLRGVVLCGKVWCDVFDVVRCGCAMWCSAMQVLSTARHGVFCQRYTVYQNALWCCITTKVSVLPVPILLEYSSRV